MRRAAAGRSRICIDRRAARRSCWAGASRTGSSAGRDPSSEAKVYMFIPQLVNISQTRPRLRRERALTPARAPRRGTAGATTMVARALRSRHAWLSGRRSAPAASPGARASQAACAPRARPASSAHGVRVRARQRARQLARSRAGADLTHAGSAWLCSRWRSASATASPKRPSRPACRRAASAVLSPCGFADASGATAAPSAGCTAATPSTSPPSSTPTPVDPGACPCAFPCARASLARSCAAGPVRSISPASESRASTRSTCPSRVRRRSAPRRRGGALGARRSQSEELDGSDSVFTPRFLGAAHHCGMSGFR